jgi:hypothetical protein
MQLTKAREAYEEAHSALQDALSALEDCHDPEAMPDERMRAAADVVACLRVVTGCLDTIVRNDR